MKGLKRKLGPCVLALFALMYFAGPVLAACVEGARGACTRNGCPGTRECVGGRLLGCEIAESCLAPGPGPMDRIVVNQAMPEEDVGILYDSRQGGANVIGTSAIATAISGSTATLTLPNLRAVPTDGSITAFSRSRQPARVPAPWTAGSDTATLWLENNLRFNVTVWILSGDFPTLEASVAAEMLRMNKAYRKERTGLRVAWLTIVDKTANPPPHLLNAVFTPDPVTGGIDYRIPAKAFRDEVGLAPGDLNVYVIDTVAGNSITGAYLLSTESIVMGRDTFLGSPVLEHEFGHAFNLWHVDGSLGEVYEHGFDYLNLMQPAVTAEDLTEGQIFRVHFGWDSQVNLLGWRPYKPRLMCESLAKPCPVLDRRVWADTRLPAN